MTEHNMDLHPAIAQRLRNVENDLKKLKRPLVSKEHTIWDDKISRLDREVTDIKQAIDTINGRLDALEAA